MQFQSLATESSQACGDQLGHAQPSAHRAGNEPALTLTKLLQTVEQIVNKPSLFHSRTTYPELRVMMKPVLPAGWLSTSIAFVFTSRCCLNFKLDMGEDTEVSQEAPAKME